MLWKELLIGYTIAGLLSVIVPLHVWNDLFLHGHGFGPGGERAHRSADRCVASCAPSATSRWPPALWRGGIGFGGVISFVFADLIAFPLLLVYRKYYGRASMLRMALTFWALMATAGLVVEGRVPRRGAVPSRGTRYQP